jgi:hypothetical protein
MNYRNAYLLLLAFCTPAIMPHGVNAQQTKPPAQETEPDGSDKQAVDNKSQSKPILADNASDAEQKDRERRLAKYLTGAKFLGNFTIEGKSDTLPKPEAYTISKCEKLPQPDMYRLTARIKYGEIDSEVPLDLKILWAGRTPVITMDAFWIPGMGTFGARVLIHSGRYAGTWQHDEVGGHLFGVIKKD